MVSIESHELEVKQKGQNNNENDLTLRICQKYLMFVYVFLCNKQENTHSLNLPSDMARQNIDG